jgi:hypothetical protein
MPMLDLTGKKFGRLIAQEVCGKNCNGNTLWKCHCECGNYKTIRGSSLVSGYTKSCGCLQKEAIRKLLTVHGKSRTTEYSTYIHMLDRCYNEANLSYRDYGGRGITVCPRWRESFENFVADMGNKPSPKHSLDRINNGGNYEPNNCRWATQTVQNINRRPRKNSSGYTGVVWDKDRNKWASAINVHRKTIHLGRFANKEDAIKARKEAEIKYHHPLGN